MNESASEMIQVAAAILLQDFYAANPSADVIATSGKILVTLLRNALEAEESDNPKYGTIRLSNPKIREHVVNVFGALDILERAGFVASVGGEYLTYVPPPPPPPPPAAAAAAAAASEHDSSRAVAVAEGRAALIEAICAGLSAKTAELASSSASATAAASASSARARATNDNAAFLGDEARRERIRRLRVQKKAQRSEREAARVRWKEDAEDRKLAARRREAATTKSENAGSANDAAASSANPIILAKPFDAGTSAAVACARSRLLGRGNHPTNNFTVTNDDDPEAVRRTLVQKCMKDPALSAKEKQAKIQDLMGLGPESILAAAAAAATADSSMAEEDDEMALDAKPASVPMDTTMEKPKQGAPLKTENHLNDQKTAAKMMETPSLPSSSSSSSLQPNSNNNDLLATSRTPTPPSDEWNRFIEHVPRCAAADGIRDSSVYYNNQTSSSSSSGSTLDTAVPKCLKRLFKELDGLKDDLPADPNCSIWLRFDEETPQYIQALITAPLPGPTPYSGGIFAFDIYVPNDYPQTNPKIQLLTTDGGRVRFGPNLYADGKVCLSLLGTWHGPKWDPKHSSLYQLLISIQGLLLGVEHPYYLEPGHGGWEGKVKEGDFRYEGRTLAGKRVNYEVGVPNRVVLYEDVLRVGTVKCAMTQPLRAALNTSSGAGISEDAGATFGDIIQAHFCENKTAILAEVRGWMDDLALGRKRDMETTPGRGNDKQAKKGKGTLQIDALKVFLPKLEELLGRASIPHIDIWSSQHNQAAAGADASMEVKEDSKPLASKPSVHNTEEVKPRPIKPSDKKPQRQPEPASDVDVLGQKRQQMQEAGGSGNYILAGKIQEEIQRLEDLQQGMKEAAEQNDFIRAGRLQAQFKALTQDAAKAAVPNASGNQKSTSAWNGGANNEWSDSNDDEDDGQGQINWNDDEFEEDEDAGPSFPHNHPGPNPSSHNNFNSHTSSRFHSWGTGHSLAAPSSPKKQAAAAESAAKKEAASATPQKKSIPREQLCRLRIRLPQDKSVVEDFDKNAPLVEVYRRLESLVPDDHKSNQSAAAAAVSGPLVSGGAFSQPFSMAGFTLLLTRPKREFNLEMHGTKSLMELNLAPSATLTVMKCSERGVMYRGEVESRLRAAQGDAMDVEGLTYEGLMELTERVGRAAPKEGSAYLTMTTEEFEANTQEISPSAYLARLESSMEEHGEEDCRCPICLGSYNESDKTPSLRTAKNCGHTMHAGCLQTWLKTNSSCPLCKVPIVGDGKKSQD